MDLPVECNINVHQPMPQLVSQPKADEFNRCVGVNGATSTDPASWKLTMLKLLTRRVLFYWLLIPGMKLLHHQRHGYEKGSPGCYGAQLRQPGPPADGFRGSTKPAAGLMPSYDQS